MLKKLIAKIKEIFKKLTNSTTELPSPDLTNFNPPFEQPPSIEDENYNPPVESLPPTENRNSNLPVESSQPIENKYDNPPIESTSPKIWTSDDDSDVNAIVKQYVDALISLHDNSNLDYYLPYTSITSLPIFYGICNELINAISIWDPSIPEEKKEIERLEEILEKCEEKISQIISPATQQSTTYSKEKSVELIFATTDRERICFLDDLKTIDSSYYPNIQSLLNDLKNYLSIAGNQKKYKQLVSIPDVKEVKDFQLRIYFKVINPKYVYVLMIYQKQNNWGKLVQETLKKRKSAQERQFKEFQGILNGDDPIAIAKLLEKNAICIKKIYEKLECKKREGERL